MHDRKVLLSIMHFEIVTVNFTYPKIKLKAFMIYECTNNIDINVKLTWEVLIDYNKWH